MPASTPRVEHVMYERFTDRARRVMQLAQQEAARLRHEYIDTVHVLLGLVAEGHGVAANALALLDIDLNRIRHGVERTVRFGLEDPWGRLPLMPRTKNVIKYAHEEAKRLDHKYVGTEHLLLGLLREEEGIAAQVLMNLGLQLEDVRSTVLRLLGQEPENHTAPSMEIAKPHIVSEQTPTSSSPPHPIVEGHLHTIRALIERLNIQKEDAVIADNFAQAAHYRDEVDALKRILAWYEWYRSRQ